MPSKQSKSQLNYDLIPEELKALPQWVCFRWEPSEADPTVKIKMLRNWNGGAKAKTNDPSTWGTFEQCLSVVKRYDGIGYIVSEDDPYTFVDLDHCVDASQNIEQWARKIINDIDSYTEFSVSGDGIHIFAKASKPGPRCRIQTTPNVEIYDHHRFVVMTGNIVPNTCGVIQPAPNEIAVLYNEIFGEAEKLDRDFKETSTDDAVSPVNLSDDEILARVLRSKSGPDFERLWNGDTSDYNDDDSAADQALCNMLAFWTCKDASRMDSLFRQSGLFRPEKWDKIHFGDGRTYGQGTIDKAIADTKNVYTAKGKTKNSSADKNGKNGKNGKSKTNNHNNNHPRNTPSTTAEQLELARLSVSAAREANTAAALWAIIDQLAILPEGEIGDILAERNKSLGSALDLRHIRQSIKKRRFELLRNNNNNNDNDNNNDDNLPEIVISNRQQREVTGEALAALEAGNKPEILFIRSGSLVRLRTKICEEYTKPIIDSCSVDIIKNRMGDTANYVRVNKDGYSIPVYPPVEIAKDILALGQWGFPLLDAITESPIFRPDGSVYSVPGYDNVTRIYYQPEHDLQIPNIPETPSKQDVNEAVSLINDVLADFPFVDQADYANAFAMVLTPVVRPAIDGCIPLAIVTAPQPGSGKGLLMNVVNMIATGREMSVMPAPERSEEWRKSITTQISEGSIIVCIDNVEENLSDPNLAAVLTARIWKDRILGTNKQVEIPNRICFGVTGNNVKLGGDIARRSYWVRLDPKTSDPEHRTGFRHENLPDYVRRHRGKLLSAVLTLGRSWYVAGCPAAQNIPLLGSFEEWSRIVGGILAYIGIDHFLGNAEERKKASDEEGEKWELFLQALLDHYNNAPFSVNELSTDLSNIADLQNALPDEFVIVKEKSEASFVRKLGRAFTRIEGKRYGKTNLHIERNGIFRKAILWIVIQDSSESGELFKSLPVTSYPVEASQNVHTVDSEGELDYLCSKCGEIVFLELDKYSRNYQYVCHNCGHGGVIGLVDYQNWRDRERF
jgi:primase-polymerase (primpol)-like protein/DNA-directed RNA polymerase subunit RPC12/RpoP